MKSIAALVLVSVGLLAMVGCASDPPPEEPQENSASNLSWCPSFVCGSSDDESSGSSSSGGGGTCDSQSCGAHFNPPHCTFSDANLSGSRCTCTYACTSDNGEHYSHGSSFTMSQ